VWPTARRWSEGRPVRRLGVVSGTAGVLAGVGFLWWPNGEYKPIQRDERGTVQGAIEQLANVGTGRPALTPGRERELGGAPTVRKTGVVPGEEEEPVAPTDTSTTPSETSEAPTTVTETTATETTPTTTEVTTTTTTTTP
jgi:hypothetical protein